MEVNNYSYSKLDVSPSRLSDIREHFSGIEYMSPILYKNNSRYKNIRTIQDDEGNIYHESWIQQTVDKSSNDEYYIVTEQSENRLDIIANIYYNTPRYWWVIALANYIIDPFDIPIGTQLRIPPLISLYNEGGVLNG